MGLYFHFDRDALGQISNGCILQKGSRLVKLHQEDMKIVLITKNFIVGHKFFRLFSLATVFDKNMQRFDAAYQGYSQFGYKMRYILLIKCICLDSLIRFHK